MSVKSKILYIISTMSYICCIYARVNVTRKTRAGCCLIFSLDFARLFRSAPRRFILSPNPAGLAVNLPLAYCISVSPASPQTLCGPSNFTLLVPPVSLEQCLMLLFMSSTPRFGKCFQFTLEIVISPPIILLHICCFNFFVI